MYEFIRGKIVEITPAEVIIEAGSIGYFIHISLNTFSQINKKEEVKLFLHQVVREDAQMLFGFAEKSERELFRMLISVSGIGAGTAVMMFSSLSPDEIKKAILEENVGVLKSIKGIGAKTAQRVIIDLKDKIGKSSAGDKIFTNGNDTVFEEASSALVMLGFARKSINKELTILIQKNPNVSVEELVKIALKSL